MGANKTHFMIAHLLMMMMKSESEEQVYNNIDDQMTAPGDILWSKRCIKWPFFIFLVAISSYLVFVSNIIVEAFLFYIAVTPVFFSWLPYDESKTVPLGYRGW